MDWQIFQNFDYYFDYFTSTTISAIIKSFGSITAFTFGITVISLFITVIAYAINLLLSIAHTFLINSIIAISALIMVWQVSITFALQYLDSFHCY